MTHVSGKLRTLRAERGLTLDELAQSSGLSKGLLSKLENNLDANPSLETLHKIASAFNLTVADLLETEVARAIRFVPSEKPAWVDSLTESLAREGKTVDEDILQALYVLQSRKASVPATEDSWRFMYRSLELSFQKQAR